MENSRAVGQQSWKRAEVKASNALCKDSGPRANLANRGKAGIVQSRNFQSGAPELSRLGHLLMNLGKSLQASVPVASL